MIASVLLIALGIYLACGLVFAIPFALVGVKRIDPHAAHGSWGFRLLIVPGAIAFWPLLLRRWTGGLDAPPEESNAHRRAASSAGGSRREQAHSESRTADHASRNGNSQGVIASSATPRK